MKAKNSVGFGAVALILSGLVSKALGALFRLPLTNLLGLEGIGVFSLVMSVLSFGMVLTSGGVTSSLAKILATSFAKGEAEKARSVVSHAMAVTLVFSALLGAVFAAAGGGISSAQGVDVGKIYLLFPLLLPLCGALCVLRGAFQGQRNMLPTATSQVLEQTFKFALGLLFAWLFAPYGTEAGVFGAFLGLTFSELVAVVFLAVWHLLKFKNVDKLRDFRAVKIARREFDSANFTLMLSALVLPLVSALDSLFIVKRLALAGLSQSDATTLFGLQSGVVGTILNLPLVISLSVSTALLPNLSFQISRGQEESSTIQRALLILIFLVLPTTFGLVAVAEPLLLLLYPTISTSLMPTALSLMFFGGFGVVLTALMQFFSMLLQARGCFRFLLGSSVLGGIFKLVLTFFLCAVPQINIYAVVIGNVAYSGTVCTLALWKLERISAFSVDFWWILLFALATLAMFCVVKLFLSGEFFSNVTNLFAAVAIGVFVYALFCLPLLMKLRKKA